MVAGLAAQPRFRTVLLSAIAALAVTMAAVGLYGVVSYSVSPRTREIGIRLALGADAGDVLAMMLREGFWLGGAGVVCGIAAASVATRTLGGLLYGIEPTDFVSFGLASAGVLAITLVSSYVPARRATRVDPSITLRCE